MHLKTISVASILAPLLGSIVSGIFGKLIGRRAAHTITIGLMIFSFICSIVVCKWVLLDGRSFDGPLYTWAITGTIQFNMGLLLDHLTVVMMLMVTVKLEGNWSFPKIPNGSTERTWSSSTE